MSYDELQKLVREAINDALSQNNNPTNEPHCKSEFLTRREHVAHIGKQPDTVDYQERIAAIQAKCDRMEKQNNLLLAKLDMMEDTKNDPVCPYPAFIRYPRSGQRCPHSGKSRTALWRLVDAGIIKTRNDGGTVYICGKSLWRHMSGLPYNEQKHERPKNSP